MDPIEDMGLIVSQKETSQATRERQRTPLWLNVWGPAGYFRYATDADAAFTYWNDPYTHAASAFRTVQEEDWCGYTHRSTDGHVCPDCDDIGSFGDPPQMCPTCQPV